ncbi:MAG: RluA family pseudouridine synthase [Ruminococcaceae bacterium]|nr:RluA family pseudouridine synthase [Oscillospiraceae bacterium]
MNILFEDKYLLLCEKAVGENSQFSTDGVSKNLPEKLIEYRKSKGEDGYIGLVHRLDVVTGGVMLYSKDKSLTGKLSELVADKEYKKTYLAVVSGRSECECGEMKDLLFHDKQKNKTYVVSKDRRGVKPAALEYKTLQTVILPSGEMASLVEIQLLTGRTHQIRAQFGGRKMPLLGDGKYGSREKDCTCALWSYKANFKHPRTNQSVSVTSIPPSVFPWNLFDALK